MTREYRIPEEIKQRIREMATEGRPITFIQRMVEWTDKGTNETRKVSLSTVWGIVQQEKGKKHLVPPSEKTESEK